MGSPFHVEAGPVDPGDAPSARRVRIGTAHYVLIRVPRRDDPRVAQLTDAELHVLRALVTGASNARVASVRKTSVRTIANQVRRIFAKTGVRSRGELVLELSDVRLTHALELSRATDLDDVLRGFAAGARDFVHESDPPERLAMALGDALGERAGSGTVGDIARLEDLGDLDLRTFYQALGEGIVRCDAELQQEDARYTVFACVDPPAPLSSRQRRVLEAILESASIKAIASDLGISDATVWAEIGALRQRLGFRDRSQMLRVLRPLVARPGTE